eukprot:6213868-Pleurochrysis_carterae.AAC.4
MPLRSLEGLPLSSACTVCFDVEQMRLWPDTLLLCELTICALEGPHQHDSQPVVWSTCCLVATRPVKGVMLLRSPPSPLLSSPPPLP